MAAFTIAVNWKVKNDFMNIYDLAYSTENSKIKSGINLKIIQRMFKPDVEKQLSTYKFM